ncbi:hypothetical protein ANRL1_01931 [Anaerolineae bacterium]|nr:hypothetical protein ANRL1_01931 [Anaerolineae bacterium]
MIVTFTVIARSGVYIDSGTLAPASDILLEARSYFNAEALEGPRVSFTSENLSLSFDLKQTAAGYSSAMVRNGWQFGCNLNRVRNRKGRWALTVWTKRLSANKDTPSVDPGAA